MFLFLDVISPIPEIFIIEENKVIFQRKILSKESQKLSDHIFETFNIINKDFNLVKNLTKTSMTLGPGSYTSLRIGAAFLSGLNISKKLKFCPISIADIFKYKTDEKNEFKTVIYFCSSQNQNFICSIDNKKNIIYTKLENDKINLQNNVQKIFYNSKKFKSNNEAIKQYKFTFIDEILNNYDNLKFHKDIIINPIYISNNKILN
tara:strand:- start:128 stop:742 length:615 start_codon:yes stop_codon:yes gene_type:complete